MPDREPEDEPLRAKPRLAWRVLRAYVLVIRRLNRKPLPDLIETLGTTRKLARDHHPPRRAARAVHSLIRFGQRRPRCLITALVLFRVLREQGDPASIVIGLPELGESPTAHAWVEIAGFDLGPPPGKGHHQEMVRYG